MQLGNCLLKQAGDGTCVRVAGEDPGFCEGGFERGFVDSLKGTFEQK